MQPILEVLRLRPTNFLNFPFQNFVSNDVKSFCIRPSEITHEIRRSTFKIPGWSMQKVLLSNFRLQTIEKT